VDVIRETKKVLDTVCEAGGGLRLDYQTLEKSAIPFASTEEK
jgi:hypothetical protein